MYYAIASRSSIARGDHDDDWISRGSSVVLRVPSAVIENENNYLINPAHTDFKKLVIGSMEAFKLDPRLTT